MIAAVLAAWRAIESSAFPRRIPDVIPTSHAEWITVGVTFVAVLFVLRAIHATAQVRNAQNAALVAAKISEADRMESERSPSLPDKTEPDSTPAGSGEESTGPSRPAGEYRKAFGVMWRIRHVAVRTNPLLAPIIGLLGEKIRIQGPYCPDDYTILSYKDSLGHRHVMEDDDINWGGSLYCTTCKCSYRPDPDYRGARQLSIYRAKVEEDYY